MPADVLMIGAGGIGAPAAWALAEAGIRRLRVADEDVVELGNLHRQILFDDDDLGRPKLEALEAALGARGMHVVGTRSLALPDNVRQLLAGASVVIDATDNFASRFMLADAAHLEGVPIVHAAAVRWQATVLAVSPTGRPCYRCLFEDLPPPGQVVVDCASAGVAGPVCGVAGAIAADRVLRVLGGDDSAFGHIVTFDGRRDRLRSVALMPRADCDLCGITANIGSIEASRYMGEPDCAAP
jgi:molybdopterin/thiamine biosynthesis adenylyltransferase